MLLESDKSPVSRITSDLDTVTLSLRRNLFQERSKPPLIPIGRISHWSQSKKIKLISHKTNPSDSFAPIKRVMDSSPKDHVRPPKMRRAMSFNENASIPKEHVPLLESTLESKDMVRRISSQTVAENLPS